MRACKFFFWVGCLFAALGAASRVFCEDVKESSRIPYGKLAAFCCVDLKPYINDATFDLSTNRLVVLLGDCLGTFGSGNGVPFCIRRDWAIFSSPARNGRRLRRTKSPRPNRGGVARADNQQPGNGAIAFANDNDLSTYWYAGDNRPHGKLTIDLPKAEPISSVRFFGFATGRHAPKDYRVGVILPDGGEKEIASVKDEKRMGQWISFDAKGVEAKGIYLDVNSTVENVHGPVIHEFQARTATPRPAAKKSQRAFRGRDSASRHRRGGTVHRRQRGQRSEQAVEGRSHRGTLSRDV